MFSTLIGHVTPFWPLVPELFYLTPIFNICIVVTHIADSSNSIADILS